MQEVTFRDFADLMKKRKRGVDDLVDLFRGKIEEPREFFDRVMTGRWHGENREDTAIPYRSVLNFYQQELGYLKALEVDANAAALKRKRGPVSDERRRVLIEQLRRGRAARVTDGGKLGGRTRENIEEVIGESE